ncbi:MAG: hypothetical protein CSA81_09435 [Acidobacteria bacterium]|nr:MAG: hypothetical protein CSA81_09435 [Acidobacteriota bacterium]
MKQHYSNRKKELKDPGLIYRDRLIFLSLCLLAWSCMIVFKLVKLQILESDRIRAQESRRLMKKREIPALRGEIRDCNGKPLAISSYKSKIILDPAEIKKPEVTMAVLGEYLDKSDTWVKKMIQTVRKKKTTGKRYYKLKGDLNYEKGRAIFDRLKGRRKDTRLAGVHVEFFPERHYPKRWLASHLVGFENKFDSSFNEGLERYYDTYLSGESGEREVLSDAMQNDLALGGRILKKPEPGAHLELTIDENIQFLVENELQYGMSRYRPDGITCIVMEPTTGDILAMANLPDFNPEFYGSPEKPHKVSRRNRAVEHQYEPASAFKIVTIASALELGLITLDQKVYCENGSIEIHDRVIKDHRPFGTLSYREVLWYSSNVGAIKAALKMTNEQFYDSMIKFGFNSKTNIDLPAEVKGHLRPVKEWHRTSPSFLAIGHEIGVTPLQMLTAANVVANGGFLVEPRVGKRLVYDNGLTMELGKNRKRKRVLSERTVQQLKDALIGVVEYGTAKRAALPDVRVFGKTGTAQRITRVGYSNRDYNASFVGFFPAEKPRYAMIVIVYNPQSGEVHGGEVAAPIFRRIGERLLWYEGSKRQTELSSALKVAALHREPTDVYDRQFRVANGRDLRHGSMPDLKGLGLKSALKICTEIGISPTIKGKGWVVDQYPKPHHKIKSSQKAWILMRKG